MTKDEIAALPRVELVFMYRFLRGNTKVQWVWGEEKPEGGYDERWYSGTRGKNIAPHAAVGLVYSFPQDGTTIYTGNNAEFVRQLDDSALLTEWKAKDRAGQQVIASLRELKRLSRQDQLRAALEPLHVAYEGMTSRERGQFIAWTTRYIMEGKG